MSNRHDIEQRAINDAIAARIRTERKLRGFTQTSLGQAIGLTFQQVQKYETGANRISASRLLSIARVLNVPVIYFYEGTGLDAADAPMSFTFNDYGTVERTGYPATIKREG